MRRTVHCYPLRRSSAFWVQTKFSNMLSQTRDPFQDSWNVLKLALFAAMRSYTRNDALYAARMVSRENGRNGAPPNNVSRLLGKRDAMRHFISGMIWAMAGFGRTEATTPNARPHRGGCNEPASLHVMSPSGAIGTHRAALAPIEHALAYLCQLPIHTANRVRVPRQGESGVVAES